MLSNIMMCRYGKGSNIYNNSSEYRMTWLGHGVRNPSSRSSSTRALVTACFCLRADANRETREPGPASWNRHGRNSVHYVLSVGKWREATRAEKERRYREALCPRVGALGLQTDRGSASRRLFPLFCAILASNPGGSSRRSRSIDTISVADISETGTSITGSISRPGERGIYPEYPYFRGDCKWEWG